MQEDYNSARAVESHNFNLQKYKLSVSNPRTTVYVHFNVLFIASKYPVGPHYDKFSKLQPAKMGPAPGRFELSKGIWK